MNTLTDQKANLYSIFRSEKHIAIRKQTNILNSFGIVFAWQKRGMDTVNIYSIGWIASTG